MKIKILYDNRAREGFVSAWGFSCLIETEEKILFDTGQDGKILLHNANKLNESLEDVTKIVISHEHWDHIGGLPYVLNKAKNAEVFVLRSFSERLKEEISKLARVHEVYKKEEISRGIFSTGELGNAIKEQSLFIETEKGFLVITGCAHPGIDTILEFVKRYGKIYWLMGGFHDFNKLEYLREIPVLSPCHCTMHLEEIKRMYPEKYKECRCGDKFEIK